MSLNGTYGMQTRSTLAGSIYYCLPEPARCRRTDTHTHSLNGEFTHLRSRGSLRLQNRVKSLSKSTWSVRKKKSTTFPGRRGLSRGDGNTSTMGSEIINFRSMRVTFKSPTVGVKRLVLRWTVFFLLRQPSDGSKILLDVSTLL